MMTYRETLLTRAEPLEDHEVGTLRDWLGVLAGDVAAFGATPEDEARMEAIQDRIWRARPPVAAEMAEHPAAP